MTDQTTAPADQVDGASARDLAINLVARTHGCSCDGHGSNGVAAQCKTWLHARAVLVVDALIEQSLLAYTPETCRMTHTEPYDFAVCETHDTTFALGSECKFNGRLMVDVLADEADEQRMRAVRAEHESEHTVQDAVAATWRTVLSKHPRVTYEQATGDADPDFGDVCRTCLAVWPCPTIAAAPDGLVDALARFPNLGKDPA